MVMIYVSKHSIINRLCDRSIECNINAMISAFECVHDVCFLDYSSYILIANIGDTIWPSCVGSVMKI